MAICTKQVNQGLIDGRIGSGCTCSSPSFFRVSTVWFGWSSFSVRNGFGLETVNCFPQKEFSIVSRYLGSKALAPRKIARLTSESFLLKGSGMDDSDQHTVEARCCMIGIDGSNGEAALTKSIIGRSPLKLKRYFDWISQTSS